VVERIGVDDPEQQELLFQHYPGGFVSASELLTIKHKIQDFKGGTFLLNVPNGDYRCTAAPYERACMIAAVFKKRRIRARILLLDMNTGIKIEKDGFHRAFDQLYRDYIDYLPSSEISVSIWIAKPSPPSSTSTRSTMPSFTRRYGPLA